MNSTGVVDVLSFYAAVRAPLTAVAPLLKSPQTWLVKFLCGFLSADRA